MKGRAHGQGGFTLVELMVVVAIMGIVMTLAVPSLYRKLHPDSMDKAVEDVVEACTRARALAILQGVAADVVIRADNGQISVQPAGAGGSNKGGGAGGSSGDGESAASAASTFSERLSDRIAIELAEINFHNIMDMEEARVRFYPNSTCDEFRMVLVKPESSERRLITLEVVTGLVDVESDPSKFMR